MHYGWVVAAVSFAAAMMAQYRLRAIILSALGVIVGGLGVAILTMGQLWRLWGGVGWSKSGPA